MSSSSSSSSSSINVKYVPVQQKESADVPLNSQQTEYQTILARLISGSKEDDVDDLLPQAVVKKFVQAEQSCCCPSKKLRKVAASTLKEARAFYHQIAENILRDAWTPTLSSSQSPLPRTSYNIDNFYFEACKRAEHLQSWLINKLSQRYYDSALYLFEPFRKAISYVITAEKDVSLEERLGVLGISSTNNPHDRLLWQLQHLTLYDDADELYATEVVDALNSLEKSCCPSKTVYNQQLALVSSQFDGAWHFVIDSAYAKDLTVSGHMDVDKKGSFEIRCDAVSKNALVITQMLSYRFGDDALSIFQPLSEACASTAAYKDDTKIKDSKVLDYVTKISSSASPSKAITSSSSSSSLSFSLSSSSSSSVIKTSSVTSFSSSSTYSTPMSSPSRLQNKKSPNDLKSVRNFDSDQNSIDSLNEILNASETALLISSSSASSSSNKKH